MEGLRDEKNMEVEKMGKCAQTILHTPLSATIQHNKVYTIVCYKLCAIIRV